MGIPTAVLKKRYEEDECKTNAKRRPAIVYRPKTNAAGRRKEWWEQWEEGEDRRVTNGNLSGSPIDNLIRAADDFKAGRTWPTQLGVEYLWDQFRRYVGLPVVPVSQKTSKPAPDDREELLDDGDISDNDIDEPMASAIVSGNGFIVEGGDGLENSLPQNHTEEGTPTDSDEVMSKEKEEQLLFFLGDPERAMKIFLSSHMRSEGLIWSDRNLIAMPRLLSFFFNFLLRNNVFPESSGFHRSLAVIDLARKELPLTSQIAKALPDNFSEACMECWGKKTDVFRPPPPTMQEENSEFELDADQTEELAKEFEDDLKASSVQVLDNDVIQEDTTTGITDESLDTGVEDNSWHDWRNSDALGNSTTESANWDFPQPRFLMALMGPTGFPITHTTGVVERSVRRVKSITPPPNAMDKPPFTRDNVPNPDPDSVEFGLEQRFTKVVMEPWANWDATNDLMPQILEASRGPVAEDEACPDVPGNALDGGLKAHNPHKDDITVFMEPLAAEVLCSGMGIGGTWVQLVRSHDIDKGDAPAAEGEGASEMALQRFWYLEELMMTLPSYYTTTESQFSNMI
ncbi:hypothetical protein BD779DRAFT_1471406 [Infundibulicybe gibba]|nr:hypothetical protein BD779DRAFT_1471406 [Infundibulicybe gibba]